MPKSLNQDPSYFPKIQDTDEHGIIAFGGDFRPERILHAYKRGIFPWPHEGLPILWFSPDPRFVLKPANLRVSSSLAKAVKKTDLTIVADKNFKAVITACQQSNRHDGGGTWITGEAIEGYTQLFEQGFAHSIEAYRDNILVGGLYGVSLGSMFFGESMFHDETNASKICFVILIAHLIRWRITTVDCQAYTDHLASFGAHNIPRREFLAILHEAMTHETRQGPWQFNLTPEDVLATLSCRMVDTR